MTFARLFVPLLITVLMFSKTSYSTESAVFKKDLLTNYKNADLNTASLEQLQMYEEQSSVQRNRTLKKLEQCSKESQEILDFYDEVDDCHDSYENWAKSKSLLDGKTNCILETVNDEPRIKKPLDCINNFSSTLEENHFCISGSQKIKKILGKAYEGMNLIKYNINIYRANKNRDSEFYKINRILKRRNQRCARVEELYVEECIRSVEIDDKIMTVMGQVSFLSQLSGVQKEEKLECTEEKILARNEKCSGELKCMFNEILSTIPGIEKCEGDYPNCFEAVADSFTGLVKGFFNSFVDTIKLGYDFVKLSSANMWGDEVDDSNTALALYTGGSKAVEWLQKEIQTNGASATAEKLSISMKQVFSEYLSNNLLCEKPTGPLMNDQKCVEPNIGIECTSCKTGGKAICAAIPVIGVGTIMMIFGGSIKLAADGAISGSKAMLKKAAKDFLNKHKSKVKVNLDKAKEQKKKISALIGKGVNELSDKVKLLKGKLLGQIKKSKEITKRMMKYLKPPLKTNVSRRIEESINKAAKKICQRRGAIDMSKCQKSVVGSSASLRKSLRRLRKTDPEAFEAFKNLARKGSAFSGSDPRALGRILKRCRRHNNCQSELDIMQMTSNDIQNLPKGYENLGEFFKRNPDLATYKPDSKSFNRKLNRYCAQNNLNRSQCDMHKDKIMDITTVNAGKHRIFSETQAKLKNGEIMVFNDQSHDALRLMARSPDGVAFKPPDLLAKSANQGLLSGRVPVNQARFAKGRGSQSEIDKALRNNPLVKDGDRILGCKSPKGAKYGCRYVKNKEGEYAVIRPDGSYEYKKFKNDDDYINFLKSKKSKDEGIEPSIYLCENQKGKCHDIVSDMDPVDSFLKGEKPSDNAIDIFGDFGSTTAREKNILELVSTELMKKGKSSDVGGEIKLPTSAFPHGSASKCPKSCLDRLGKGDVVKASDLMPDFARTKPPIPLLHVVGKTSKGKAFAKQVEPKEYFNLMQCMTNGSWLEGLSKTNKDWFESIVEFQTKGVLPKRPNCKKY